MRALALVLALPLCAADWPGYGGPTADFHAAPVATPLKWQENGPRKRWQRELGDGYSGIVVEGSVLYTMYRRGGHEVVASLSAEDGRTLWETVYDAPLPVDFDTSHTTGPRATPLITGDLLFTIGAGGKMHALNRKTGAVIWKRDFVEDFGGKIRVNGYAPSPVAWRDTVIVLPNARDGAIAALRQSNGEVVWRKHSFVVSYATPLLIRSGSREQLVAQFSDEVTGLDPGSGELLWSHPHTNDQKVNVAAPVWSDGLLFLSSAYSGGSQLLRVVADGNAARVDEVWKQRQVRVHHSNAVRIGDTIYAATGDLGPCPLSATEMRTGRVLWRDRTFQRASLVVVGAQLLMLDEDGNLALASPDETGLNLQGKMHIMNSESWTAPTVVGKSVYLRDRHTIAALTFQ